MIGTWRQISPIRSISSGSPASRAMASRCSTAFVEPPMAATDTIALCSASAVSTLEGRASAASARMAISPTRRAAASLSGTVAGMSPTPNGARPRKSATVPMVLAVYWAAQVPAPGQACLARSSRSAWSIRPTSRSPSASHMSWMVTSFPRQRPGSMLPL